MTDIQLDRQMMNIDVALGPLLVDEENFFDQTLNWKFCLFLYFRQKQILHAFRF